MTFLLCVGTAGTSVWFSRDLGETWTRPYTESGLYLESRVWALSAPSGSDGEVWAGTDRGVHRWRESEQRWTHLPSPLDELDIWSLAHSPHDPDVVLAGTQPASLWRSDDAGRRWTRLETGMAQSCIFVGDTRVTQILFDPVESGTIWAGVEIDAVHRSRDGGRSWERLGNGLVSDDIHGVAVVPTGAGTTVFAATNKGLHRSVDRGASWQLQVLDSPWQYTRSVVPRADGPGTLFLTNGDGPPGSTGRLLRSRDFGETWQDARLPVEPNSTPWCLAMHPEDPNLVFLCTNLGQLFRSTDGGLTWTKLRREFGEIRSLLLCPT